MSREITGSNGTLMTDTIKILLIEDNEVDAWMIQKYLLDVSRKEDGVSGAFFDLVQRG